MNSKKTNLIWNLIMILLLYLQTNIIFSIIKKFLFPNMQFIKSIFNEKTTDFIKIRVIIAIICIILFILIEIITIFIINKKLSKNLKYYSYLNKYMIFIILIFIGLISFYIFKIINSIHWIKYE